MIDSYVKYIDSYLSKEGLAGLKEPGEHHFVSVYLVPKLYSITEIIPDYVNPDGTKSILGDIVYYKDGKHSIGIEVKLGTIRLTANEFNNWILNPNISEHPCVFIGVGTKGLVIQSWSRFRETYIELMGSPSLMSIQQVKKGKYGPQKSMNVLIDKLNKNGRPNQSELFLWTDDEVKIKERENHLENELSSIFMA